MANEPVGLVIELLANTLFKVRMEDSGKELICYLAGKLRIKNINIRIGDRVKVVVDPMGGKATNRIIWRL